MNLKEKICLLILTISSNFLDAKSISNKDYFERISNE